MGTLTTAGYAKETAAEYLTRLRADWLAEFGAGTDVSDDSPDGVILRILSQYLAEQDESVEAVYQAIDPDSAAGVALDLILSLLGLARNAATKSTIASGGVLLTGTPATVVPIGTRFSVSATGLQFEMLAPATIGGGGTITTGVTTVLTGPTAAAIGALDTIDTPVAGLTSVSNTVAATVGTDEESDEEARGRREASLSATGRSTVDSIYARLADLDGVTSVKVIENATGSAVGLQPAYSVQCIVYGGTAQEIVDEIWSSKPAGIPTYGTSSGTATDAAGDTHTVEYTVPSLITVHIRVTLTTDSDYPTDGAAQVKERILYRLADGLTESEVEDGTVVTGQGLVGEDVLTGMVVRAVFEVPGIVTCSTPLIDTVDPPVATGNLAMSNTQVASYAIANIDVL